MVIEILDRVRGVSRVIVKENQRAIALYKGKFHGVLTPGEHVLACRATDDNGDTQPLEVPWDTGGFGNNVVQRMRVWVR